LQHFYFSKAETKTRAEHFARFGSSLSSKINNAIVAYINHKLNSVSSSLHCDIYQSQCELAPTCPLLAVKDEYRLVTNEFFGPKHIFQKALEYRYRNKFQSVKVIKVPHGDGKRIPQMYLACIAALLHFAALAKTKRVIVGYDVSVRGVFCIFEKKDSLLAKQKNGSYVQYFDQEPALADPTGLVLSFARMVITAKRFSFDVTDESVEIKLTRNQKGE